MRQSADEIVRQINRDRKRTIVGVRLTANCDNACETTYDIRAEGSIVGFKNMNGRIQGTRGTEAGHLWMASSALDDSDFRNNRRIVDDRIVGKDGVAVFVNRNQQIQEVSFSALRGVFLGDKKTMRLPGSVTPAHVREASATSVPPRYDPKSSPAISVHFGRGNYHLEGTELRTLEVWLRDANRCQSGAHLAVYGFASSPGSREYNEAIGYFRARQVHEQLAVERLEVSLGFGGVAQLPEGFTHWPSSNRTASSYPHAKLLGRLHELRRDSSRRGKCLPCRRCALRWPGERRTISFVQ